MKNAGLKAGRKAELAMFERIGSLADSIEDCANALAQELAADHSEGILAEMQNMRIFVDSLEKQLHDDLWPLPKYREMLFIL